MKIFAFHSKVKNPGFNGSKCTHFYTVSRSVLASQAMAGPMIQKFFVHVLGKAMWKGKALIIIKHAQY